MRIIIFIDAIIMERVIAIAATIAITRHLF